MSPSAPTRKIVLALTNTDHCKRLSDPTNLNIHHCETLLAFSEAVKLERGNANVRPAKQRKPMNEMLTTVQYSPECFHLKNRGITYLCDDFKFDNATRQLTVTIPNVPGDQLDDADVRRFGIADGGHTYAVIKKTVDELVEHRATKGWCEPYVRVHFFSCSDNSAEVEDIVEALNTSLQVKQYTLDEYSGEFDGLKDALRQAGFVLDTIAFRENEEKEWHVVEIIQRMACFLRDRWQVTQPASMYKSKAKALDLYTGESSRMEFEKLYDVIRDVITLPEFIQAEFSLGNVLEGRRFGGLKAVKKLKKACARSGTPYKTEHQMHIAAVLPMAAAFRELLVLRGDRYQWKTDPYQVFRYCATDLYQALVAKLAKARNVSQLGADTEYWATCAFIVMRAKDTLFEQNAQKSA
jgi:hypothetical protein